MESTIKDAKKWIEEGKWKRKVDKIVDDLKREWGEEREEWEGRLHQLCADCGEGSLYMDVIYETDDGDERDMLIAAVDEYIKDVYGVEV